MSRQSPLLLEINLGCAVFGVGGLGFDGVGLVTAPPAKPLIAPSWAPWRAPSQKFPPVVAAPIPPVMNPEMPPAVAPAPPWMRRCPMGGLSVKWCVGSGGFH